MVCGKMKIRRFVMKHYRLGWIIVISLALFGLQAYAADDSEAFCYVSLLEGGVFVRQAGSSEPKTAVVNFPLLPGDAVETGEKSRCELQFDNGTILRMDSQSNLNIKTLRADSLTSNKKITLLELTEGRIFSMNNTYNRELFQLATPLAAVKMAGDSTTTIAVEGAGTRIFVDRGKIGVLFGDPEKKLDKKYMRSGEGALITATHEWVRSDSRGGAEFQLWNEYVNKHFEGLHYGISKLPKPIYQFPPGVVRFAEKWSSLYGEWEYNDLLGYVWKPYDDSFKYPDRRPFFHARFVTANNQLYMVPTQPWGWIPAHLGNWVWMNKNGWVWIPGTAFKPGMYGADWLWAQMKGEAYGLSGCWTLSDWIHYVYGDYAGYAAYRRYGHEGWRARYNQSGKSKLTPPPVIFKDVPKDVAIILERLNRAPLKVLNRQLSLDRTTAPEKSPDPGLNARKARNWLLYRSLVQARQNDNRPEEKKITGGRLVKGPIEKRDWNPDRVIAHRLGTDLVYSSHRNSVMFPELKVSSRTITDRQKFQLRTMAIRKGRPMNKTSLIRHFAGGSANGSAMGGNADTATPTVSGQTAPVSSSKVGEASERK